MTVFAAVMLLLTGCDETASSQPTPEPPRAAAHSPEPAPRVADESASAPQLRDVNSAANSVVSVDANTTIPDEPNDPNLAFQHGDVNATAALPAAPAQYAPADDFHSRCAAILQGYVDDNGRVDYKTLSRKRPELAAVLDDFRRLDRTRYEKWSPQDKTAFWLNAYNLQLIRIILDNYPIQSSRALRLFWPPNSIRHIKGIWDEHKFIIMDEEFTLKEIDQRFIRQFHDPRVFFGVSYASLGGPLLRNEPYFGEKLDKQLEEQVMAYLASPCGLRIDRGKQRIFLSSVLQPSWYGSYFVEKFGIDRKFKDQKPEVRAVLNFITNYLDPKDVDWLETANYAVEYMNYDWILNDAPGSAMP